MSTLKYDALIKKFEAESAAAKALLEIYFVGGFGAGVDTQIIDEMDQQVEKLVSAENKIQALQNLIVVQGEQDQEMERED